MKEVERTTGVPKIDVVDNTTFSNISSSIPNVWGCHSHSGPVPAGNDTCMFWIADSTGRAESREVWRLGREWSLHGWWAGIILPDVPNLGYDEFHGLYVQEKIGNEFMDTSSTSNYSCCCGQYHEYTKHGGHSGRTYHEWITYVHGCLDWATRLGDLFNVIECY